MVIKSSEGRIARIKLPGDRLQSSYSGDKLSSFKVRESLSRKILLGRIGSWASFFGSITGWCLLNSIPVMAQIASDGTLGTEVNTNNDVTEITGGTRADSNLFHSFRNFSVATDNTAFFNNASNISNIINRVTGGNLSRIDGLIKANGNANLILINPSGINFGANAQLDIGGSFLGTTAESLLFEDGTVFSATDTQVEPLLTISVPLGLQLGQNSGTISVSGSGHSLSVAESLFSTIALGDESGFRVKSGQTLALVGGEVILDGGTIAAPGGSIEIGSVAEGIVDIALDDSNLSLDYENITGFDDIQLRSQSLADASGTESISGGSIQVRGKQLALDDGSLLLVQNQSGAAAGAININTSESVTVSGINDDGTIPSSVTNETLGVGRSGDINITTSQLTLDEGATIVAKTLPSGTATGGNIKLQVEDSLSLRGSSKISSDNFGAAAGGRIDIETNVLNISDRSSVNTTTFATGNGGNIDILAKEIQITGTGFSEFQQNFQLDALSGTLEPETRGTGIFIGTVETGTAGNLTIETNSLSLREGAIIFAPVFTAGTGGNFQIVAENLDISSSAIQAGAGLESLEPGSSGNINLETDDLIVRDGGTIINLTFGDAAGGDININAAESIEIRDTPSDAFLLTGIYTNTSVGLGLGGDINLNTKSLKLEDAVIGSNTGALLPDGTIIPTGGLGGSINIQAAESIEVGGIPTEPALTRGIGTTTYSDSDAGDLTISTDKLMIRDGADFSVATLGSGDGGQLTINATDSVDLIGKSNVGGINQGGFLATSGRRELPNLESSGASGNISINTPELSVSNGASIDVQSLGMGSAGNLAITADSILLANQGNLSAATQSGIGGDIEIDTNTLKIERGLINASVLGAGTGGNIEIKARDSVEIIGAGFDSLQENFFNLRFLSIEALANIDPDGLIQGILAATLDEGTAGTIDIDTANLQLSDGSLIATATVVNGTAGSISIQAAESLQVDASVITASTIFSGKGGDIDIETGKLDVMAGGQIIASTLGSGDGGNLTINATESLTIEGALFNNSLILNNDPMTGESLGNLMAMGPKLNINENSAISVASSGTGDAGTLQVIADSIFLNRQGTISAATQSGTGGNIFIDADNVIWRGNSTITATSAEAGNGGNITIDADNVVALEGSQLNANANEGIGGNVQIDTQGLFICGECQITASSQLGVDGVVRIETLEPDKQLEAVDIPQQPTQPQEIVAVACAADSEPNTSELNITGRGGLPPRPQEPLSSESLLSFGNSIAQSERSSGITEGQSPLPPAAHGWYLNDQGTVVLTAQAASTVPHSSTSTNPDCHVR